MGPLNSIFAAIDPIITTNLSGLLTPSFGTSGTDRMSNAAPPRIVWVPTTEDIQPVRGQGGDVVQNGVGAMNLPNGSLAPLMTRVCNVECDLWGANRDTVETMINATVSAVHDAMAGSYGVVSARWLAPEEIAKAGEVYRVTFQFMIPIVRVAPQTTLATINSIPETPQFSPLVAS